MIPGRLIECFPSSLLSIRFKVPEAGSEFIEINTLKEGNVAGKLDAHNLEHVPTSVNFPSSPGAM
jgi:hypothetical protein